MFKSLSKNYSHQYEENFRRDCVSDDNIYFLKTIKEIIESSAHLKEREKTLHVCKSQLHHFSNLSEWKR